MEGIGPWWLVPSSPKHHQMLPALTSNTSMEFCNNRRENKASQSSSFTERNNSTSTQWRLPIRSRRGCHATYVGARLAQPTFTGAMPKRKPPVPLRAIEARSGRLRAGSSPSSAAAAAAGMLRSAASGGQRPLQLGGSESGVRGLRQPAGAPGPHSPKHRWPGAFISHPVRFPQIHRLRPLSPGSSPASPRGTTDRAPLSLSLSFPALPEEEGARRGRSSRISPPRRRRHRSD
ncbi:uncharacterized protein LOC114002119 [Pipra filicauda]|uniref:Uncharacterized protein LOC114002119 n=1 Tax=Pipra filicauda TaxID=649802 RepID=A0A7R5K363_9PASS|nr:uncharacterized protein LOC114002119 [Pipra filicauda]